VGLVRGEKWQCLGRSAPAGRKARYRGRLGPVERKVRQGERLAPGWKVRWEQRSAPGERPVTEFREIWSLEEDKAFQQEGDRLAVWLQSGEFPWMRGEGRPGPVGVSGPPGGLGSSQDLGAIQAPRKWTCGCSLAEGIQPLAWTS
jgi:hypothetical protein